MTEKKKGQEPEKNYVAYFSEQGEFEFFETHEEAEQWLRDWYYECYPDDTISGRDCIAKVTHRSSFTETDRKENYKYVYEDDIPEDDDESEAWPHSSEFDVIGTLTFEKIAEEELK